MTIEVKVPVLPESVSDATIVTWHKKVGDRVTRDENLVDLETDKVVLEVPAPADGVLSKIFHEKDATVEANQVLANIDEGSGSENSEKSSEKSSEKTDKNDSKKESEASPDTGSESDEIATSPAVRRMLSEHGLTIKELSDFAHDGRLTKENVEAFLESKETKQKSGRGETATAPSNDNNGREERRVPMSRLRAKIAERLVQAQQNAAMLTTFNEVNLQAVMDLRAQYKTAFEKKHGIKLGFMSFFVKAVIEALKRFPAVNASVDGQDIVYHGYYDIGIAVSTERGLVVPVLRNASQLTMAEIEQAIADAAERARQGKLSLEEMQGGTFTITNGGVFGSLLATPIINPPQTGILGMHKIEERPVVENGQIVIRPMMYLALSYDHRLIDGKDSVQFLVNVKQCLEDPARILLDV